MVTIASEIVRHIVKDAAASPGEEICGLLFGEGDAITGRLACRNVAADPARFFEIDPAALFAAHRAARSGRARIVGHYHSHPTGVPVPSARDAAQAVADGTLWLIVGGDQVRAWRAVAAGRIEGRFDPVDLRPTP